MSRLATCSTNCGGAALIIALCVGTSGCIETIHGIVRVQGFVEPPSSDAGNCKIVLSPSIDYPPRTTPWREIRGQFSEEFLVHPIKENFLVTVKCGETVMLTKTVRYREFGDSPHDLGVIKP
jgi:hypothetical protein